MPKLEGTYLVKEVGTSSVFRLLDGLALKVVFHLPDALLEPLVSIFLLGHHLRFRSCLGVLVG